MGMSSMSDRLSSSTSRKHDREEHNAVVETSAGVQAATTDRPVKEVRLSILSMSSNQQEDDVDNHDDGDDAYDEEAENADNEISVREIQMAIGKCQ